METLKYTIEDKTIAVLLGVQNFSNKESAILELVKNAYDANSSCVDLIFKDNEIIIKDYGIGMDESDIKKHWMHVGKSDKGYLSELNGNESRVLAGSKGVGRFALARLGESVEVITRKSGNKPLIWKSDWEKTTLEIYTGDFVKGTVIHIFNLRDRWSSAIIKKMARYLSLTYNDDVMKINLHYKDEEIIQVERFFKAIKLGVNCTNIINLNYNSKKMELSCEVICDEFKDEAVKYYNEPIDKKEKKLNILNRFKNQDFSNYVGDLEEPLTELGDFSAQLYFSLGNISSIDIDKFLYKHKITDELNKEGIVLYRNAFSISSYEGRKDWLQLGKRSRKSPAAATHTTGSWRVRENQITGKVIIDKKENIKLQDMANRQGLDESVYFELFVKIIQEGLGVFENFRQDIIRKINIKNQEIEGKKPTLIEKVINNPRSLKNLEDREVIDLVSEMKNMKSEQLTFKSEIVTTEKRYKYDIRILNVLATLGLKAMSIAHELHNDRNKLDKNCERIILALKEYGFWETLNTSECQSFTDKNIPDLIESNEKINKKMVVFMDTMLEESEKEKFSGNNVEIISIMSHLKKVWEYDYSWIKIDLTIDEGLSYLITEDVVHVIFDNLILNSIQQNDQMQHLEIKIAITLKDGKLKIEYADNGRGLDEKYKNDPFKMLEVHETSRKNGHGLGMWIVNNTLDLTGGTINDIKDKNGFFIIFEIGDKTL